MKYFISVLVLIFISNLVSGQRVSPTKASILAKLSGEITTADGRVKMLVTNTGFNVLMQKKTFNYLTGVSDLSFAKFYGAYSSDNDKLNLGFNIPTNNPYTERLKIILNPIIEIDVKNNFATLYKDSVWKNNIRVGFKFTYLPKYRRLKFYANGSPHTRKNDFAILRTTKYNELKAKLDKEEIERASTVTLIDGSSVKHNKKDLTKKEWIKKEKEIFEEFAKAEVDIVEKELAYNRIRTWWWSVWGFTPLSKTEQYITPSINQQFTKTKFNLWELNFQVSYLDDWRRIGTFYYSAWIKFFQNNSANASLMKNVDYHQYSQLPGTNPINFALLETNKGYIGDYKEFRTTNLNLQLLYFLPIYNTLIKPGLSFRVEKNFGDYNPLDLRFGIPFTIQGKEKPINIELQYKLTNLNNYKNELSHKVGKTVGLSLGFPFVALYK